MRRFFIFLVLFFFVWGGYAQNLKKGNGSTEITKMMTARMMNGCQLYFLYENKAGYHFFCSESMSKPKRKNYLMVVDKALNTISTKEIPTLDNGLNCIEATYKEGKIVLYCSRYKKKLYSFCQCIIDEKTLAVAENNLYSFECKYSEAYNPIVAKSDDGSKRLLLIEDVNSGFVMFAFDADGTVVLKSSLPDTKNPCAYLCDVKISNDGSIDILYNTYMESIYKKHGWRVGCTTFFSEKRGIPEECSVECVSIKKDGTYYYKQDFKVSMNSCTLKKLSNGEMIIACVLEKDEKPHDIYVVKLDENLQKSWEKVCDITKKYDEKIPGIRRGYFDNQYKYLKIDLKNIIEMADGTISIVGQQTGNFIFAQQGQPAFYFDVTFYGDFMSLFLNDKGDVLSCNFNEYNSMSVYSLDFTKYPDATCNDYIVVPMTDGNSIGILYNDCFKDTRGGYSNIDKGENISFKFMTVKKDGASSTKNLTGSVDAARAMHRYFMPSSNKIIIETRAQKAGYFEQVTLP